MSSIQYKLKSGEHLNVVAQHFGFGSLEPITSHPDNQSLLSQRGGVDGLRAGDIVTIPEGKSGKKDLAPGRGHVLTVKRTVGTFSLIVEVGFRLHVPEAVGDITRSPGRWRAFSGPLKVGGATATIAQAGGGPIYTNVTDKRGRLASPMLADGEWTLQLDPDPAELSAGCATADPAAHHWLEIGKPRAPKPTPANGFYQAEYQPLKIKIKVVAGAVESASVSSPSPKDRPVPAVLFWKGLGEGKDRQFLHIDWKPDFLRRISPKLRPAQRQRTAAIDLIMIHQTAGTSIGSALNTFLPPAKNSGAHFLNDLDGHLVRLADDDCFTQHGGGYGEIRPAQFNGKMVNERAIGIENVHADANHLDTDLNPFTPAQYTSLVGLIKDLRKAYSIPLRNVIGHQDATPKARCPGPHFDWTKLEEAGVSLAPSALTEAELETMFGGFFAGHEGRKRAIRFGDLDKVVGPGFAVKRGENLLIEGLSEGPIRRMADALEAIGYHPDQPIYHGGAEVTHHPGRFDKVLAFCLSQFLRHFATGPRIRTDQPAAYLEIALGKATQYNRITFDFRLAVLLRGAELASAS